MEIALNIVFLRYEDRKAMAFEIRATKIIVLQRGAKQKTMAARKTIVSVD